MSLLNHGFGGSHIADNTCFAPRLIYPFRPRVIVLYAGDNDIAYGLSPQQVADDYVDFSSSVRKALPDSRIIYISIKPSLAQLAAVFPDAGSEREHSQADRTDQPSYYVDVGTSMLGADGHPRQELFSDDGLHLSPAGYALWTGQLQPVLTKALREHPPRNGAVSCCA